MKLLKIFLTLVFGAGVLAAPASSIAANAPSLQTKITQILQEYVKERGAAEHINAASVSITTLQSDVPLVAAVGSKPTTLFQIGSNTKAFTSVLALQLQAAGKLDLDAPIGQWLPQYPAWKNVTVRHMLNMTSGIPTYDNDPAFQRQYAENPYHDYTAAELVAAVYPKNGHATFLKGWNYSNTGYVLTQMILEKITGRSYADLLNARIFKPYHLTDLYYDRNVLPAVLQGRVSPGYFYNNQPDNAGLKLIYNRDVRNFSLSWTQAAGGIVATPAAVDRWVHVLYGTSILPQKQRDELRTCVSMTTGKPIAQASPSDPRTFGLGIGEMYRPSFGGRFMFYEGMTLGYRVVHLYAPQRKLVMTVALNSQPDPNQDHVGVLIDRIVNVLPPNP